MKLGRQETFDGASEDKNSYLRIHVEERDGPPVDRINKINVIPWLKSNSSIVEGVAGTMLE